MATYALLPKATANRVYGESAFGLAAAEIAVLDEHVLGGVVGAVARVELGGVDYLRLDCGDRALDDAAVRVLSNGSTVHALFEEDGGLLRPLEVRPVQRADDDVITIQRYAGKTNEALTHLMVNLALAVAPDGFGRVERGERVRLLDPACGRGTTLNRGIVYGLDVVGIEHDKKDLEAYGAFLLGWLQDKRLKHEVQRATLRKGREHPALRSTVTYGPGKDRSAHRTVEVVHDDTVGLATHVPARTIDLLVCDLPYGVQHGSTLAAGMLRRSPDELLEVALPVWRDALRPGAGVALAWNLRTLPRRTAVARLQEAGFELCTPAEDDRFQHRVDRSIQRDVVLARRPRA